VAVDAFSSEWAQRFKDEAGLIFTVDTLEFLRRGGRIGRASAWAGQLLHVKPILTIKREVVPLKRVRGNQKAMQEFVSEFTSTSEDTPTLKVGIAHADAPERAEQLKKMVHAERPHAEVEIVTTLGAVVGRAGRLDLLHQPLGDGNPTAGGVRLAPLDPQPELVQLAPDRLGADVAAELPNTAGIDAENVGDLFCAEQSGRCDHRPGLPSGPRHSPSRGSPAPSLAMPAGYVLPRRLRLILLDDAGPGTRTLRRYWHDLGS